MATKLLRTYHQIDRDLHLQGMFAQKNMLGTNKAQSASGCQSGTGLPVLSTAILPPFMLYLLVGIG
ncbi:MAG: hypothetical protein RLZZ135_412 [Cyanobacteriota bacterium]|jgi:hypothetical protein